MNQAVDATEQGLSKAQAFFMQGQLGLSSALLTEILANHPDQIDALHLMGIISQKTRNPSLAYQYLSRAAMLGPTHADILSNCANVLRELSRFDESLTYHTRAAALAPRNALIHINMGLLLQDMKRYEEAESAFRNAVTLEPESAIAHHNLGHLLIQINLTQARQHLIKALQLNKGMHAAFKDLCAVLISQGEPNAALNLCTARLSKVPGDQDALATLAIALRELGRNHEADQIVNCAIWLQNSIVNPPNGYKSMDEFNLALEAHVRNHPKLTSVLFGQATHNGKRVNDLLEEPKGPISELETIALERIQNYLHALPILPNHPFFKQAIKAPGNLRSWAILMHRNGYETPHIHPDGLVSGVYYVRLPKVISETNANYQGWIEFGEPDPIFVTRNTFPTQKVQPVEGSMLLFPSYIWHRTIPFDSDQERLSIAFDFVPIVA